jgi:hypothetical protein
MVVILLAELAGLVVESSGSGHAQPKMEADAPVVNFMLPMFGVNGYKTWDIRGLQGRQVGVDRIEIDGLVMRIYEGDSDVTLEAIIESPEATVLMKENKAYGNRMITASGCNYQAIGVGWEWNANERKMTVFSEVKVVFRESLECFIE